MPQRSRRSIGYRTFITCDDPNGVVECGTARKLKSNSTQKEEHVKKFESQSRKQKFARAGEEAQSSTASLHLLEVSREAQKLNHVARSWSDVQTNNNNRDMAKDLLKGAVDLGESLAVLSKWQSSSKYISGSSKKHLKQKKKHGGFVDDVETEGRDPVRFRNEIQLIQDGFGKKSVLSDPSSEEARDDRRLDSSDVPSTSSSQSSIVHSSNFVSPESIHSYTRQQKKKKKKNLKGSSLIARLMGLEDVSLRSLPHNQKKPAFDVDSPRARKHEDDSGKPGWKRRTLDQMIEAVKFKGDLKERWEGLKSDNKPPIVVLRPLRFSCRNAQHPIVPKTRAEMDEEMLLKMRIRTNPLAQTHQSETLNINEKFRKENEAEETKAKGKAPYKVNGSGREGEVNRRAKSESDLKFQDGNKLSVLNLKGLGGGKGAKNIDMLQSTGDNNGKHGARQNWPEIGKEVLNGAFQTNGNRTLRDEIGEADFFETARLAEDASQIEITDYVDDDHSSPSETPLLYSNWARTNACTADGFGTMDHNREIQRFTSNYKPAKEKSSVPSEEEKQLYSVYDNVAPQAKTVDHASEKADENSVCRISAPSINHGPKKGSISGNELKALLLSSPPFIHRAEELFGLEANPEQTDEGLLHIDFSVRMLVLDCANELLELYNSKCSANCPPLPSISHHYTSFNDLLDEICDGIEALSCYGKANGDADPTDCLLLLVKGDLKSRSFVSGLWDIGWINAGSADEYEEITKGVDKLVIDRLVEEIVNDLVSEC